MPMPVARTSRSPTRSISRPAGKAKAMRRKANALITEAAAAVPTPKSRAKTGRAGATMPKPSATKKATTTRTPTSRGRSARGDRSTLPPLCPDPLTVAERQEYPRSRRTLTNRPGPAWRRNVRRLVQLLSLLTLVTSGVMLAGSFTWAEASGTLKVRPGVLQTAWFWQNALEQVNPPAATGPAPATEPSGVPDGDLPVAHTSSDAGSSKMSVVAFDLGAAAVPGTLVSEFTVTLTVDGDTQATNAGTPAIVACLPTQLWSPANGGDYSAEPPVDCSLKVKPRVKGSSYTFDITSIAQDWIDDQNIGVAFVNDPDNTQTPYQVVFSGAKTVKAAMAYTPPVATTPSAGGSSDGGSMSTGVTPPTTSGTSTSVSAPPPASPPSMANAPVTTQVDPGQTPQ